MRLLKSLIRSPAVCSALKLLIFLCFACLPTACTTAIFHTYKMANNPLPTAIQLEDKAIDAKAMLILHDLSGIKVTRYIQMAVFNRRMILVGEVPSRKVRRDLTHALARIPEVTKLYNYLTIGHTYGASQGRSDAIVELKIKAAFIGNAKLNLYHYAFVVYRGEVYIFGQDTAQNLNETRAMIRQIVGVKKVITFFHILK